MGAKGRKVIPALPGSHKWWARWGGDPEGTTFRFSYRRGLHQARVGTPPTSPPIETWALPGPTPYSRMWKILRPHHVWPTDGRDAPLPHIEHLRYAQPESALGMLQRHWNAIGFRCAMWPGITSLLFYPQLWVTGAEWDHRLGWGPEHPTPIEMAELLTTLRQEVDVDATPTWECWTTPEGRFLVRGAEPVGSPRWGMGVLFWHALGAPLSLIAAAQGSTDETLLIAGIHEAYSRLGNTWRTRAQLARINPLFLGRTPQEIDRWMTIRGQVACPWARRAEPTFGEGPERPQIRVLLEMGAHCVPDAFRLRGEGAFFLTSQKTWERWEEKCATSDVNRERPHWLARNILSWGAWDQGPLFAHYAAIPRRTHHQVDLQMPFHEGPGHVAPPMATVVDQRDARLIYRFVSPPPPDWRLPDSTLERLQTNSIQTPPDDLDPRQLEANGIDYAIKGVHTDWFMRPKAADVSKLEADLPPPPTLDGPRRGAWAPSNLPPNPLGARWGG